MKSAYELAIERLGGTREYSEAKKEQLAEIDSRYEARIAEVRLHADDKRKGLAPGSPELQELQEQLSRDVTRLEAKREAEKDAVRRKTD